MSMNATTESAADFHRLEARLRLQGALTTRTALRIGSGGAGAFDSADLPVLKDAGGFPFVPGASIKGALRSTIEALVRGATSCEREAAGLWACDPLAKEDHDGLRKSCGHHEAKERDKAMSAPHCAVCQLFGSHVLASHVRFCDAMIELPDASMGDRRSPIELRDGVAIDRDLKTVYKNQKYDFEVVSPGTRFGLEVYVENPRNWLMGLLAMGFDQLGQGFTALGGFASRGLGRVELAWSSMTRFTAEGLLLGQPPTEIQGPDVDAELRAWQGALAERAGAVEDESTTEQGGH